MKKNHQGVFYSQKYRSSCGIALIRAVFENKFNVKREEDTLIKRAQKLYEDKCNGNPHQETYTIRGHGTDVYHFKNLAEYYGLKAFSKKNGKIEDLEFLIDNSVWPIIHRKFEEDHDGHYLLVYNYDNQVYLFDPILKGIFKQESYEEFDEKWLFKDEKWFIFLYKENSIKIPFRGKYL